MKYTYYPGCSLETSSRMYDSSLREVFAHLGLELVELPDWNCCGATAYFSIKETVSLSVSARNLAIAEQLGHDVVAPCASCFTILMKTHRTMQQNSELRGNINEALQSVGLSYQGKVKIRHPLEVLLTDVGLDVLRQQVVQPLKGMNIAPYYGCQIARGEATFDNAENPIFMDQLFHALGATISYYPNKVRCCGGMLMYTFEEVALRMCADLMRCALENGSNAIATTCPMCHANLDLHQEKLQEMDPRMQTIPIYFFTQLIGIALGISTKKLGLDLHHIQPNGALKNILHAQKEVAYV